MEREEGEVVISEEWEGTQKGDKLLGGERLKFKTNEGHEKHWKNRDVCV